MWGVGANFVRRTRNGARLCVWIPCAKNRPRVRPRPKTRPRPTTPCGKCIIKGWAIALVGGWAQLRPPDLEWADTLRSASVCPRDIPATTVAKNGRPKSTDPQPPSGKWPKRGVGYSLGGGLGPTSSAGLGIGLDFAYGLHVPKIGRGHGHAQKRAPERPRPTTPLRKMPKSRGGL